jgi:hypothetical protein
VDSWAGLICYPRRTFYPLIDGPSTQNHRVTKTCFRICLTCRSHSQAPLCLCTLRLVSNQAEGTFVRLRYHLGGDRPSQTTRLTVSSIRIHGFKLEFQHYKGGISLMPPLHPKAKFHRLPPMLRMEYQNSMLGYSKGARGLSVPQRVSGIFTGTTISLSLWPRQRGNRYTIHAGRNLPDKEFRYLRTVIVTAAVYRGFSSELLSAS